MRYLLDTNVISELRKRRPDPGVADWYAGVDGRTLHLSVLTVGEIARGIGPLARRDQSRATGLQTWLDELLSSFADRVVPVTSDVAVRWGGLNVPDPLPTVDGLLAATALSHSMTLVTRNTRDVERTGVVLHNPFRAP